MLSSTPSPQSFLFSTSNHFSALYGSWQKGNLVSYRLLDPALITLRRKAATDIWELAWSSQLGLGALLMNTNNSQTSNVRKGHCVTTATKTKARLLHNHVWMKRDKTWTLTKPQKWPNVFLSWLIVTAATWPISLLLVYAPNEIL